MFKRFILDNGMRLIFVPKADSRIVSIFVVVQDGSDFNSLQKAGISHFLEHIMFQGTKKKRLSAKAISSEIEGVGGNINANTDRETVCYMANLPSNYFQQGLDVLSDMLLNSQFAPERIENIKGAILEEWKMIYDIPIEFLENFLWPKLLYGNQPAGRCIAGTIRTIKNITKADLLKYVDERYNANSMVIAVSGNIDADEVYRKVNKYFKRFKNGIAAKKPRIKEFPWASRVLMAERAMEQTNFYLGVKSIYSLFSPEIYALRLLSVILGENMSSRLFQQVREVHGLAYAVGTSVDAYSDRTSLFAHAGVEPYSVEKTITIILAECRKIADSLVSKRELDMAREFKIGNLIMSFEEPDSLLGHLVSEELFNGEGIRTPDEIYQKYRKVTVRDIKIVAQKLFQPQNFYLAVIGLHNDKERFKKLLQNF